MAAAPYRHGLKIVGRSRGLLVPKINVLEVRCAGISGKAMRAGETVERHKPWPYKERGYNNFHAYLDGTSKRLGENSKVVIVEGLPCIGKTEVAKALAEEFEMKHFPMVTMNDYYINPYGYDMRKVDHQLPAGLRSYCNNDFVKNPNDDRSPIMQFTMYFLKYMQYVDALKHILNTGQGVVLERSCYSDIVFLETMFSFNYVNRKERDGYLEWKNKSPNELLRPHLIVYLDAAPEVVEENLRRRGRGEEKVFNRQFLERMDHIYKEHFIRTISEHAEVLVYDWNTPGDSEVIIEDIERLDFDKYGKHDMKLGDWRIKEDWDWSEKRWWYTSMSHRIINSLLHHYFGDTPRLYMAGEETKQMNDAWFTAPGMEYSPGFNAKDGDTGITFKTKHPEYEYPIVNKSTK